MSAEPAGTPDAHIIPQGILESSIKITNEPPTGMLANLHKALDNFNQVCRQAKGCCYRNVLRRKRCQSSFCLFCIDPIFGTTVKIGKYYVLEMEQ